MAGMTVSWQQTGHGWRGSVMATNGSWHCQSKEVMAEVGLQAYSAHPSPHAFQHVLCGTTSSP
eukprot:scaffold57147_cov14-Tisochrysis_lutea.AAC.1